MRTSLNNLVRTLLGFLLTSIRFLVSITLYLPLRIRLLVRGNRYYTFPFSEWHTTCPMCGGTYARHVESLLGTHMFPGEELFDLVREHEWKELTSRGFQKEFDVTRGIVGAVILVCPKESAVTTFVFQSTLNVRDPHPVLLFEEQLSGVESQRVLETCTHFKPIVSDRLKFRMERDFNALKYFFTELLGIGAKGNRA